MSKRQLHLDPHKKQKNNEQEYARAEENLLLAIQNQDTALATKVIEANPKILEQENGATFLLKAIKTGKIEILDLLIKGRADINYPVFNGQTSLLTILQDKEDPIKLDLLHWMINNGANVNQACNQ